MELPVVILLLIVTPQLYYQGGNFINGKQYRKEKKKVLKSLAEKIWVGLGDPK